MINLTAAAVVTMDKSEKKMMLAQCHAFSSLLAVLPFTYYSIRISWNFSTNSIRKEEHEWIIRCFTLMKTMLGNTKVRGKSVNDPKRLTKSPMNGNIAVTNVFSPKTSPRKMNRRCRLALENIFSSNFWNLVSRASWIGAQNIWFETQ